MGTLSCESGPGKFICIWGCHAIHSGSELKTSLTSEPYKARKHTWVPSPHVLILYMFLAHFNTRLSLEYQVLIRFSSSPVRGPTLPFFVGLVGAKSEDLQPSAAAAGSAATQRVSSPDRASIR